MESVKRSKSLVLATATVLPIDVVRYNNPLISRLLNKGFCRFIDENTTNITLKSIAVMNCSWDENIRAAIKRRVVKCVNLQSIDMSLATSFVCLCPFQFMKELVSICPTLWKIQSNAVSNWLVSTTVGTRLFMTFEPHASLMPTEVLQILCLCIMAVDFTTLNRFYSRPLDDLIPNRFLLHVSQLSYVHDDTVQSCLHYTDGASRCVTLKRNKMNDIWEVVSITEREMWTRIGVCDYCE